MTKVFGDFGHIYEQEEIDHSQEMLSLYKQKYSEATNSLDRMKIEVMVQKYEDNLAYMPASRTPLKKQPTVDDIISYASSHDLYPKEAAEAFGREFWTFLYDDYVLSLATISMRKYAGTIQRTYREWCDVVMKEEDTRWEPQERPLERRYRERQIRFQQLQKVIGENQDLIIDYIIQEHLGQEPSPLPDELYAFSAMAGMDGFFKDVWNSVTKVVLSPLEKLVLSPVAKVFSKTAYALLPDRYAAPLANLSQASAQILAGKISKESIQMWVKSYVKVAIMPSAIGGKVLSEGVDVARKVPVLKDTIEFVDDQTGLISSFQNILEIYEDVLRGQKLTTDYLLARTIDAAKIGILIFTGGTAAGVIGVLAQQMATKIVVEKTGLDEGTLGVLIKAASGVASGNVGAALEQASTEYVSQKLREETVSQIAKQTNIDKALLGQVIQIGVDSKFDSETMQAALTDAAKQRAIALAKAEAQKEAEKQAAKLLGDKYKVIAKVAGITADAQAIANKNINSELTKLQGKAEELLLAKVEESSDRVNAKREEIESKIINVQEQYKNVTDEVQRKTLQSEYDRLHQEGLDAVTAEQSRLAQEAEAIKADSKAKLNQLQQDYNQFDLQSASSSEYNRLSTKVTENVDNFKNNWQVIMLDAAKKYGPDLAMYLYMMYGPKPDYDQYLTSDFIFRYGNWKQDAYAPKKSNFKTIGLLAVGGLALAALTKFSLKEIV